MTRPHLSLTLASYQEGLDLYLAAARRMSIPAHTAFRQRIVDLLPPESSMLELGTGPGHDALYFEARGVRVRRTDAVLGFVERLRAEGYPAEVLDMSTGDLGGPSDVIFANAVLLHLKPDELDDLLARAARAVRLRGVLAFTVKEGDGEAWSTAKLDRPRFFHYWREEELRTHLAKAGWHPVSLEHVDGRLEPWMYVICTRGTITG